MDMTHEYCDNCGTHTGHTFPLSVNIQQGADSVTLQLCRKCGESVATAAFDSLDEQHGVDGEGWEFGKGFERP